MIYRVDLSRQARVDLREIALYVQAGSSEHAQIWFAGLETAIQSLREFPERGKRLDGQSTLRQWLYGSRPHVYRILYRVEKAKSRVSIVHIRHGAREGSGV